MFENIKKLPMLKGDTSYKKICGIALLFLLINVFVAAFAWTYTINFWLGFFGRNQIFMWYFGIPLGFIPYIGQASIPIAILTFVISYIL